MVYPCKGCMEKDNCEKNKCKKLKDYKKFRSENIKKNRVWAKESVDVKYRKEFDSLQHAKKLFRDRTT